MFAHVEVETLEARETRRVKNNPVELEALLACPAHILERVPAEKFTGAQVETVQRVVFAALVENLPADVGVRRNRSAPEARVHRKTASVAEEVEETRTVYICGGLRGPFIVCIKRLTRLNSAGIKLPAGHRAESVFHLEAHVTHIEEQPRIDGIEQVHMEARVAFAHRTYGIFAGPERNFHRSVLQGFSRTGEAFLHHDARRIELRSHSIYKFTATREHLRPEELHLKAVAEPVERHARKTVGGSVHNAVSVCHIEQRCAFFICSLE